MAKKKTKQRIVDAAWDLFYEKGYENTTIEDIISGAGISKGTFYYNFNGKEDLLNTLSQVFDSRYEELLDEMDESLTSFDKLLFFNDRMNVYIEDHIDRDLLASLYALQVTSSDNSHLLDQNRVYYQLLSRVISEGQVKGELRQDITSLQMIKLYALLERAFVYDWCITKGSYSLVDYSREFFPLAIKNILIHDRA